VQSLFQKGPELRSKIGPKKSVRATKRPANRRPGQFRTEGKTILLFEKARSWTFRGPQRERGPKEAKIKELLGEKNKCFD